MVAERLLVKIPPFFFKRSEKMLTLVNGIIGLTSKASVMVSLSNHPRITNLIQATFLHFFSFHLCKDCGTEGQSDIDSFPGNRYPPLAFASP